MDNQNQKNALPQPINPKPESSTPSVGGQKVIQPTEAILQHIQDQSPATTDQEPHIGQPASPTQPVAPVINTDSQQASQSAYIPSAHSNDESVIYGHNQQTFKEPKRRILKWVSIGLVIIIIAGLGILVDKNQGLRATILRQKFVAYTYPVFVHKEPFKITVDFYRNSSITDYAPPTPPGDTPLSPSSTLMSPVQKGASAITLRIVAGPDSSASLQAEIAKFNACDGIGESKGPTIYIPSLAATADMCQISGQINGEPNILGYSSGVTSTSTHSAYLIILSSNYSYQTTSQDTQVVNAVNFLNYQSDVQSIVSSIKFIRT